MVLGVAARPLPGGGFRIESAFAQHLRTFKHKLGDLAEHFVLMGPALGAQADNDATLATIGDDEGFEFVPLFPAGTGRLGFLKRMPSIWRTLHREVARAQIVHGGPSHLYTLFEFPAVVMAHRQGKKTVYITDIDNRRSPEMLRRTGALSLRQYLFARWLWGASMNLQHRYAARHFSLVMFKGARMAADFGQGRSHVKNFFDVAFESHQLIDPPALEAKAMQALQGPLKASFFGRLVAYKGVDHMLRAVKIARDSGAAVEFEIIGDGPERPRLEALARDLGMDAYTRFVGAVSFGEALFARLQAAHVLLAAPLSEDTPRSAFDALASGIVLVAYDTYYYRELKEAGAPVTVVPWLDHAAMGRALCTLAADRAQLSASMVAARSFAAPNTQEAWLDRRIEWTRQMMSGG